MLTFGQMQMDELSNTWVEDLQKAFEPYAHFVDSVAARLEEIELEAILHPPLPVEVQVKIETTVVHSAPEKAEIFRKTQVLSAKQVLLVDDAEINRVLMSHYFKGLPVKLEFASSGEIALTKCKLSKFDLIVVDDELQNPTSFELAKSLHSECSAAVLVALSNREEVSSLEASLFTSILQRGLPRELFVDRLKSYLWQV